MSRKPVFERFDALGTTVVVGSAEPGARATAMAAVRQEVDACDRACSRFRDDSDLARLHAGESGPVSEWLCDAVAVALEAADLTEGLVDPTIGQCLIDLGYDRSFESIDLEQPLRVRARHVPAWRRVRVDRSRRRVHLPFGARLDLGATAKALCADRAAARAATLAGSGVLVSLGGDISVAGPPPTEGWVVRVTDRADAPPDRAPGQTVAIRSGGLATSGTSARRWARDGAVMHHLVDPRTGRPADEAWRTISVAAPTCVQANIASTAAMIIGWDAPTWLSDRGADARLVRPDGGVTLTGGWPPDPAPVLEAVAS
ncbi:MAG: FAD:protein FMN transferase [Actinomycetota bacterium]|nr:FAD:protein FMN transferase [Actinomycetota bacterium]